MQPLISPSRSFKFVSKLPCNFDTTLYHDVLLPRFQNDIPCKFVSKVPVEATFDTNCIRNPCNKQPYQFITHAEVIDREGQEVLPPLPHCADEDLLHFWLSHVISNHWKANNLQCNIIYFHFGDSTCTARAYKYDENEEEFFVETEETVRIRKSDLETFQGVEETGSMPSSIKEVRALSLMETPQPKAGQGQPALPGPPPPNSKTDAVEAKSNLDKFLESLHKKASQATGWVSSLEPPSTPSPTPKQKAFLDLWLFLYTLIFIGNVLHTVINPKCNSHSYYNIII